MTFTYANAENTLITDGTRFIPVDPQNSDYAKLIADGATIEPYVAPPAPIPDISALQMLSVLALNAYIAEAEALDRSTLPAAFTPALASMSAQDQTVFKIRWANLTVVPRTDPMVTALGAILSLTEAQIDDLFIQAAGL